MGMADQRSVARNDTFLFGLEDAFQVACLSWYIDVQYLADDTPCFLVYLMHTHSAR
jgi:hypothetical protein